MTDDARGPVADHPHAVLAEDSAPHGGPPSAPPRPPLVTDWRFKHILIPALVPLFFFAVVAVPVEILGCLNRGLLAVGIAMFGMFAALGAAFAGLKGRLRRDPASRRWSATILVLIIPGIYILWIAYPR